MSVSVQTLRAQKPSEAELVHRSIKKAGNRRNDCKVVPEGIIFGITNDSFSSTNCGSEDIN